MAVPFSQLDLFSSTAVSQFHNADAPPDLKFSTWNCGPPCIDEIRNSGVLSGSSASNDLPSLSPCTLPDTIDFGKRTFLTFMLETEAGLDNFFGALTAMFYQMQRDPDTFPELFKALQFVRALCSNLMSQEKVVLAMKIQKELLIFLSRIGSLNEYLEDNKNFPIKDNPQFHIILSSWQTTWKVLWMLHRCKSVNVESEFKLVNRLLLSGLVRIYAHSGRSIVCNCLLQATLLLYHISSTDFCSQLMILSRPTPTTGERLSTSFCEPFDTSSVPETDLFDFLVTITNDLLKANRIATDSKDYGQVFWGIGDLANACWEKNCHSVSNRLIDLLCTHGIRMLDCQNIPFKFKNFIWKIIDTLKKVEQIDITESSWDRLEDYLPSDCETSTSAAIIRLVSLLVESPTLWRDMQNKFVQKMEKNILASGSDGDVRTTCVLWIAISKAIKDSDRLLSSIAALVSENMSRVPSSRVATMTSLIAALSGSSNSDSKQLTSVRAKLLDYLDPNVNGGIFSKELVYMIRYQPDSIASYTVIIEKLPEKEAIAMFIELTKMEQEFPDELWNNALKLAKISCHVELYNFIARQTRKSLDDNSSLARRRKDTLHHLFTDVKSKNDPAFVLLYLDVLLEEPRSFVLAQDQLIPLWLFTLLHKPESYHMSGEGWRVSEQMWTFVSPLLANYSRNLSSRIFPDVDSYIRQLFEVLVEVHQRTFVREKLAKWISPLVRTTLERLGGKAMTDWNVRGRIIEFVSHILSLHSGSLYEVMNIDEKHIPQNQAAFTRMIGLVHDLLKSHNSLPNEMMETILTNFIQSFVNIPTTDRFSTAKLASVLSVIHSNSVLREVALRELRYDTLKGTVDVLLAHATTDPKVKESLRRMREDYDPF